VFQSAITEDLRNLSTPDKSKPAKTATNPKGGRTAEGFAEHRPSPSRARLCVFGGQWASWCRRGGERQVNSALRKADAAIFQGLDEATKALVPHYGHSVGRAFPGAQAVAVDARANGKFVLRKVSENACRAEHGSGRFR
jgi:hypothetical protein